MATDLRRRNRNKSKVKAKVEHWLYIIKRLFGFSQVRYRRIAKNLNRLTCESTARDTRLGEPVQRSKAPAASDYMELAADAACSSAVRSAAPAAQLIASGYSMTPNRAET
jgi:hypothetical protein